MPRRRRRAVAVLPARRGPCRWAVGADIREARQQSTGAAAADPADAAAIFAIIATIVPPVNGEI